MKVAMLAHSVNPRGGVGHAMSLCDALGEIGVKATLHAPDASGRGFFRKLKGPSVAFPVAPAAAGFAEMIEQRVAEYVTWFEEPAQRGFDVYHAHDGISANALRALKRRGVIDAYARTVHHVDDFVDPRVAAWERRSIEDADALFTVSETWRRRIASEFGREATIVGNGVDLRRFGSESDGREATLRERHGISHDRVILALGGVEARKNTLGLLEAFQRLLMEMPFAQLVIAGGVSLIDHSAYRTKFDEALERTIRRPREGGDPGANRRVSARDPGFRGYDGRVHLIGAVADADMPALYRLADVVAAPSLIEGFGLTVIEAMATNKPVVVSRIAPFTDYLADDEARWCDPHSPQSIADALRAALSSSPRDHVAVAARFPWGAVACRHLPLYQTLSAPAYA